MRIEAGEKRGSCVGEKWDGTGTAGCCETCVAIVDGNSLLLYALLTSPSSTVFLYVLDTRFVLVLATQTCMQTRIEGLKAQRRG